MAQYEEPPIHMLKYFNLLLTLALLEIAPVAASAQTPPASEASVTDQVTALGPEQYWRRTRFHFAGQVAMPSDAISRSVDVPVFGGAFAVEFASRSRVRPLMDLNGLYVHGNNSRNIESSDYQQFTSNVGLRWFPAKNMTGLYLDMLWGISLNIAEYSTTIHESRMMAQPALSVAAGLGAVVGPVAFSLRYQIQPNYNPWDEMKQWDGRVGFVVMRMGFALGGGLRSFSSTPYAGSSKPNMKGSTRSQLAWQTLRADSLEQEILIKEAATQQLEVQQTELRAEIERQKRLTEQAEKETDSLRSQAPEPITPQFSVLHENVYRFNAIAVYTVLHPFSTPLQLDTFRVVTTIPPGGGYKHELQIATVKGNLYKEEFYALPLPGVTPGPTADEERELLRVRMALAPDAFLPEPVSDAALALSEAREARDLVFQLTKEQFKKVLQDHPPVGFRFQSDERTTKVLVYSPSLDRIVNIQPE